MTHYHYYIECGQVIDATTRIFKVGIGTTRQADRDFLYLVSYAMSHGHYFHICDSVSSEFVLKLIGACREDGVLLTVENVTARVLVRSLKKQERVPLDVDTLRNDHHAKMFLDSNYRIFYKISNR